MEEEKETLPSQAAAQAAPTTSALVALPRRGVLPKGLRAAPSMDAWPLSFFAYVRGWPGNLCNSVEIPDPDGKESGYRHARGIAVSGGAKGIDS